MMQAGGMAMAIDPRWSDIEGGISADERTYATFLHVVTLAAFILLNLLGFLGPLVMWLLRKQDSWYVDDHGREATNFSLSLLIYSFVIGVLIIPTVGVSLLLFIPLYVVCIVGSVRGAIAAQRGELYRYPMCLRLIASPM